MPNTITPNMSLIVPTVGAEPGPTYALDINSSLSLIDQHDHSAGKGVPITPSGLAITADLSFQSNNAISLRSTRFSIQSAPLALGTDLNCLYDVSGNLYFNDGIGNQIQITSNGGVNSGNGNITDLTPPAALTYVSATPAFVATSSPTVPANFDGGSLTIRRITANSNGVTLTAPASLPSNYSLTFPSALPASQKIATIDNSGNIAANYVVDNSTIGVSGNNLEVKAGGITSTQLASGAAATNLGAASVTYPKIATNGGSASVSGTAAIGTTFGPIFGSNIVITPATNNGVLLQLCNGNITINRDTVSGFAEASINITVNSSVVYTATFAVEANNITSIVPSGSVCFLHLATSGVTYSYNATITCSGTSVTNASAAITGAAFAKEIV